MRHLQRNYLVVTFMYAPRGRLVLFLILAAAGVDSRISSVSAGEGVCPCASPGAVLCGDQAA